MQVFVDEATDFSPIQLACTMELTHPAIRSWFASGDILQRVTSQGIRDLSELALVDRLAESALDIRNVDIGYRQSRRLRELVVALARIGGVRRALIAAPDSNGEADVMPLLLEDATPESTAHWIADRITEIETALRSLPSIAVFVDGDGRIDPLVASLRGHLAPHNIQVVGCKDGRVIGDNQEVRVFDVRHIKGLEFEAVFFVGLDDLESSSPDLWERYFYVGASRAATYLAVTTGKGLPAQLAELRPHFDGSAW